MVYILVYTMWYMPFGTYHWSYGIYHPKVVYTMGLLPGNLPDGAKAHGPAGAYL
jgi:hypothetical protein